MGWGKLIGAGLLALSAANAKGRTAEERHADLIHADLPLYGAEDERWPRAFSDGEDLTGCESRVGHGEWVFRDAKEGEPPSWYRFTSRGPFTCYLVVQHAGSREELDDAPGRHAYFFPIGEARTANGKTRLWVLQEGERPGSDYLLLATQAGDGEMIARFDVLQRKCPAENVRAGRGMVALVTRYCAVNSKRELVALAEAMLLLKPLGTLTAVDESDASDSSKP